MHRSLLDTRVLSDPSWWHWALTIPLLGAHLLAIPWAIELALALCAVMALSYFVRLRRVRPFPVQLRLAYFAWLLVGLFPMMHWMHYVALIGTTAMVTVGYCALGRMLSLLGFNRSEPLTPSHVWRVLVAPPAGGLFYRKPRSENSDMSCSCSLRARGEKPSGPAANHCSDFADDVLPLVVSTPSISAPSHAG